MLRASSDEIFRLATVNALLVFVFTVLYELLASFIGPFIGGIVLVVALIAAGVFYSRMRTVVIKP